MPRGNGSYTGQTVSPNANVASGIWTVREAEAYLRAGKWPAQPTVPSAPTGTGGDGQVSLTWTAPADELPVTDYIVQYSSNGGSSWTTFSDGTSAATSVTVTGLTLGTGYIFRVIAVNTLGQGPAGSASGTIVARSDPWDAFLNAPESAGVVAAYDLRDIVGGTLAARVGPAAQVFSVTQGSSGGLFDAPSDYIESTSSVSVTYPFTIACVSNATGALPETTWMSFAQSPPMACVFLRAGLGFLPYNGVDNQYLGFEPTGQWYFIAVSFLATGIARYYIKTASQVLEGTVASQSSPQNFNGTVAFGKFFNGAYPPQGDILLGVGLNRGCASLAEMQQLYSAMLPIFSAQTGLA